MSILDQTPKPQIPPWNKSCCIGEAQIENRRIANASCIQLLLNRQEEAFFSQVQKLSRLQFDCFKEMIPQEIEEIWGGLLESNEHVMKLCGAGGGGYFLLFSKNKAALEGLSHHDIIFL